MLVVAAADQRPLAITIADRPSVASDDVLVAVEATGVCHHDVLQHGGRLPGHGASVRLGHEIAGRVIETGPDADPALLGRAVVVLQRLNCAECRSCVAGRPDLCRASRLLGHDADGGYAQFVAVPARAVVPVPEGTPWAHAALLACPLGTGVRALLTVGALQPGHRVLITGASGGLGVHQVQIASALGAEVVAVTRSAAKVEVLEATGATKVVVAADFSAAVWAWTGREGVDLAIENVGTTLAQTASCLAPGGHAVVLGNVGVGESALSVGRIIARRLRISGSGSPTREDVLQALALLRAGRLRPQIEAELPFAAAQEAHARVAAGTVIGRIVLRGW
jgi:D-arabinose 1-dehydrogenase-like Zn-dependent alcohol dehydrogenase